MKQPTAISTPQPFASPMGTAPSGFSEPSNAATVMEIGGKVARVEDDPSPGLSLVNESITESAAFKAWFGESKVVDFDGNPLVVYHGSPVGGFEAFDLSKVNPYEPDAPYNGFWFSASEEDARSSGDYPWGRPNTPGGGETRAFYLSLKNPASRREARQVAREVQRDPALLPDDLSIPEATRLELQRRGFDGVIHEAPVRFTPDMITRYEVGERVDLGRGTYWIQQSPDEGCDLFNSGGHVTGYSDLQELIDYFSTGTYVAFDPMQIKLAHGNCGRFDPMDPRISA